MAEHHSGGTSSAQTTFTWNVDSPILVTTPADQTNSAGQSASLAILASGSGTLTIDTGITMLMAENARTSFVWDTFMKNPEAKRGMAIAGFQSYTPAAPQST